MNIIIPVQVVGGCLYRFAQHFESVVSFGCLKVAHNFICALDLQPCPHFASFPPRIF